MENKGNHPTRGLDVSMNKDFEKLQLLACEKGTSAGKIERWRSTIRKGLILAINDQQIDSIT